MIQFIQDSYTEEINTVFQIYKKSYNAFLNKAYAFDDYIGKDKNPNVRDIQYLSYPIWLTLFIIEQNTNRGKNKTTIIEQYELEALRKCFGCFGVDIDIAIQTIDFNEILQETGSIIAGANGVNLTAIGSTFKINGGLVVTAPIIDIETISLLEELLSSE